MLLHVSLLIAESYSVVWIYHKICLSVHPDDGCLRCLELFQVKLLCVYVLAGSYSGYMFNILTNSQAIFQSGCTVLRSYQWNTNVPVELTNS